MQNRQRPAADTNIARFVIFAVFAALVALGGGSSRAATTSLLYLRPAAVVTLGLLALTPGGWDWRPFRVPLLLLGAFAGVIAVQLVPLPPAFHLPGHEPFAATAALTGAPLPWRPISIAPDLTVNSLLALLPALVVLVAFAGFRMADRARVLWVLIAICLVSAQVGVIQLAGGRSSIAYLYAVTSFDLPVGLLANRNHQATLMAIGIGALAAWTATETRFGGSQAVRLAAAGAAAGMLALVALVGGSRTGLLLMLLALVGAALILRRLLGRLAAQRRLAIIVAIAVAAALFLAALLFGRALALDRLVGGGDPGGEYRVRALPTLWRLLRAFTPWGTGFGTFDPAFRMVEPNEDLALNYFNNAHDDFLELVITGGVPALLVGLAGLAWFARRALITVAGSRGAPATLARLGVLITVVLLVGSATDYPLRTPLMSFVGAIGWAWLAAGTVPAAMGLSARGS